MNCGSNIEWGSCDSEDRRSGTRANRPDSAHGWRTLAAFAEARTNQHQL